MNPDLFPLCGREVPLRYSAAPKIWSGLSRTQARPTPNTILLSHSAGDGIQTQLPGRSAACDHRRSGRRFASLPDGLRRGNLPLGFIGLPEFPPPGRDLRRDPRRQAKPVAGIIAAPFCARRTRAVCGKRTKTVQVPHFRQCSLPNVSRLPRCISSVNAADAVGALLAVFIRTSVTGGPS